jgi:PAS domain S-box-containing protein
VEGNVWARLSPDWKTGHPLASSDIVAFNFFASKRITSIHAQILCSFWTAGQIHLCWWHPVMPINSSFGQDNLAKEPATMTTLTVEQILDLVGLIPNASIITDETGRIILVNHLAEQLFGYAPDEFLGRAIDTLLPERHRDRHAQHRAGYMANPQPRPMETRLDLIALHRDGSEFPVEVALSPLASEDGFRVLAVVRDISRRKQEEEKLRSSQEQMRALTDRLLTLREEERARISRSVHDDIGQMLSGLKMDLGWLQKRLDPGRAPILDKTRAMSSLIDDAVLAVRRISTELRPGILDDIGLEAAVEWQLQEFQRRTDIRCSLISDMEESFPDAAVTTAAFRILQEALTNVALHAQASQVEVVLTANGTELTLVMRDDGRGITESEIRDPRSIGLLGMRERARMRGGKLEIQGVAGKETNVSLQLPLTTGEEK